MEFDINDLRGILTAVIMFAFLGVCAWAYSSRRKPEFDAIAELPLEEDEYPGIDSRENA